MAKLYNMTKQERLISANIKRKLRRDLKEFKNFVNKYQSLDKFFNNQANKYSDLPVITDEYCSLNYSYIQLKNETELFASGLQALGVRKGDCIALFSENNGRWLIADQAICKCGGISTLRGIYSTLEEYEYIIDLSESIGLICQNVDIYEKLKNVIKIKSLKFVILLFGNSDDENVYSYEKILDIGNSYDFREQDNQPDDARVMIFTSGTTSMPKGVLLTHSNILHQIFSLSDVYYLDEYIGCSSLHYLPAWHAYEYSFLYVRLACGLHLYFTNITKLKESFSEYKIDFITSVPKIWLDFKNKILDDLKQNSIIGYFVFNFGINLSILHKKCQHYIENTTIYNNNNLLENILNRFLFYLTKPLFFIFYNTIFKRIKTKYNLNFKDINCAAGGLPISTLYFYEALGIRINMGYGLTETSPALSGSTFKHAKYYIGASGPALKCVQFKIVDSKTNKDLGFYKKGLIKIKSPSIMKEYYKNPEETKKVFDDEGWLNTGDLGWLTYENHIVITGREKEIIVLSNGHNVNPVPIEASCLESPYIEQIVLAGQDKNYICALIVPSKAAYNKIKGKNSEAQMRKLIERELEYFSEKKQNLQYFETIEKFAFLKRPFTVQNGLLNNKGGFIRNKIYEKYKDLIESMYQ